MTHADKLKPFIGDPPRSWIDMSSDQPAESEGDQVVRTERPDLMPAADTTPTPVTDRSPGDDSATNRKSDPVSDDAVEDSCSGDDDAEYETADDEPGHDHSGVTDESPKPDVRSHGKDSCLDRTSNPMSDERRREPHLEAEYHGRRSLSPRRLRNRDRLKRPTRFSPVRH